MKFENLAKAERHSWYKSTGKIRFKKTQKDCWNKRAIVKENRKTGENFQISFLLKSIFWATDSDFFFKFFSFAVISGSSGIQINVSTCCNRLRAQPVKKGSLLTIGDRRVIYHINFESWILKFNLIFTWDIRGGKQRLTGRGEIQNLLFSTTEYKETISKLSR